MCVCRYGWVETALCVCKPCMYITMADIKNKVCENYVSRVDGVYIGSE